MMSLTMLKLMWFLPLAPYSFIYIYCYCFFFSFIFISWRLITLQYCSCFCHTLTWISHGFTCIPHPDPPSHFPLHPLPLGLPSAPGPSTCLTHPTWAGSTLFLFSILYHNLTIIFPQERSLTSKIISKYIWIKGEVLFLSDIGSQWRIIFCIDPDSWLLWFLFKLKKNVENLFSTRTFFSRLPKNLQMIFLLTESVKYFCEILWSRHRWRAQLHVVLSMTGFTRVEDPTSPV